MSIITEELMRKLTVITDEEKEIISGAGIDMSRYSDGSPCLVDYNKMLEKGKLFTIRPNTRFISFPTHKHNYVEIIYMCNGSQKHIINEKKHVTLKKGELLILNQNSFHSTSVADKDDIAINMVVLPQFFNTAIEMIGEDNKISQFLFSGLTGKGYDINYMHFDVSEILPVQNLIENLVWSVVYKQPNRKNINQITMGLLFLQLLGLSDRLITDEQSNGVDNIVMTALTEIEQNFQNASLKAVAERYNVSAAYVSSMVKEVTGKTFKEHLKEKRLSKAAYLLDNTEISVNNIIYMVGYENTSYFYNIFFKKYGVSPKDYRRNRLN